MGYAFFQLFQVEDETDLMIILFGVGIGVYYTMFNVAHFLLAEKYSTIAKRIPAQLDGKPEPVVTTCDTVTWWVLLFCNVASGLVYGYSLIPYYRHTLLGEDALGTGFTVYRITSTFWVRICSIISGVILIKGVSAIQSFFLERDAEDFIDLDMLRRHSLAFKLYLIGSVLTAVSLVFVNIN